MINRYLIALPGIYESLEIVCCLCTTVAAISRWQMDDIHCEHSCSSSSNQQAESIDEKRPVRLPSTPCLPGRPKYEPGWLKIIATLAEANAIRPHSWASRLKVINQVGESVASVGSSEEDVLGVC
jgi:hypothetical protein